MYDVFFGPEISANGFERSNSKIPHDMLRCHRRWPIVAAAGSIGTHLRAKVQPHAPSLLDAACTQAFSHSLAEANVAILLAATGECSSCQCLSASALLVVFPVACPYSSLFVTVGYAAIVAAPGSIGTHLRAKVQPHAPSLLDAACTQAFFTHWRKQMWRSRSPRAPLASA